MQWIAILAAIGWCFLQAFLLFLSVQCMFGLVDFERHRSRFPWLDEMFSSLVMLMFYALLLLPFISCAVFIYGVMGITDWQQLMPGVWVSVGWLVTLLLFFVGLTVKEQLQRRWP
ncbi:MAG: hypothetical protein GYB41_10905 [Oceanospirillales bacterium]|nr:hypothetical protein [Oceanospirillales bacterium]